MKIISLTFTFVLGVIFGFKVSNTKEPQTIIRVEKDTITQVCTTYVPIKINDVKPIQISYKEPIIEKKQTTYYSDYRIESMASNYFKDEKSMQTFIKYIKTQSGRLDEDNWFVIQAMINRLDYYNCSWDEYYHNPKINNSNSIRLMKLGKLKKSFSYNDAADAEMVERIKAILDNTLPDSLKLPNNVLDFESCKKSPNKGVHKLSNLFIKRRHRFYRRCLKK